MSVFIIAEAGVNHNNNLQIAKEMIIKASECGADAIKFQTFKADKLAHKELSLAPYQKRSETQNQYEMLKKLELSEEFYPELVDTCKENNIEFMSTPFDEDSAFFLNKYVKKFKIGSGDIRNYPLLHEVSKFNKPIILSTGMSDYSVIDNALEIIGKKNVNLLHCTTAYPAPYNSINLSVIPELKKKYNLPIGYSDHTEDIHVSLGAVVMGAEIIEKHFTLDRKLPGPDQKASIEPHELKNMVKKIRDLEQAIGKPEKKISETEKENMNVLSRKLIARKDIHKGDVITYESLTSIRAKKGIPVEKSKELVGTKSIKNIKKGEIISL